jgi:hypothetical protein
MATTMLKKTLILKEDQLFFFEAKKYFHLCKGEELEKLHVHLKVFPLTIILVEQLKHRTLMKIVWKM